MPGVADGVGAVATCAGGDPTRPYFHSAKNSTPISASTVPTMTRTATGMRPRW
ncbi:MAG: hypothetical protein KA286_01405 [Burkholderiales bacterium]|nr:hypothetical protein [Burkholderiales bacterium]